MLIFGERKQMWMLSFVWLFVINCWRRYHILISMLLIRLIRLPSIIKIRYLIRLYISGSFSLAWENPYVNVSFHATGVSKRYASEQNIKANELKGYIECGVSLYRSFRWKKIDCSLRGDIQNIGDKQYSIVKSYPMPGRSYKLTFNISI